MAVTPNSIVTPQTPQSNTVTHTTQQNTWPPTTNPTNTTLLVTAGSTGGRLTRLSALPHETTAAAGVLQVYRSYDGGTTKTLAFTAAITNDTVSGTDAPIIVDFGFSETNACTLKASERWYVAHSLSSKVVGFTAEWGDY